MKFTSSDQEITKDRAAMLSVEQLDDKLRIGGAMTAETGYQNIASCLKSSNFKKVNLL